MAKWTLANIKAACAAYLQAQLQANPDYELGSEPISGLMLKIAKTISIDGNFNDKLPELDGENLEFGQAIEEYFINMVAPIDYNDFELDYEGGADEGKAAEAECRPYRPKFETVAYSERLGRKVFPITIDDEKFQVAFTSPDAYANLVALEMKKLYDSLSMWRYGQKKQLLGNVVKKAENIASTPLTVELAKPVDTETGEAWIKAVKNAAEDASFVNEGNALSNTTTIGAEEGLYLYIKKGIMSSVEVDTLAGAFNSENLKTPCTIKVVENFGDVVKGEFDADETTAEFNARKADFDRVYAMIVDPRGVKLHTNISKIKEKDIAIGDYRNLFAHTENTGFISLYTFVRVYKEPSEEVVA